MRHPRTTTATTALRETAALAARTRDLIAIWGRGRFDPRLREEVMHAVAQANACHWCTLAHRRWALAEGAKDEELAAIEGQDPERFDRRSWAAIAWAQARTRADLSPVPTSSKPSLPGTTTSASEPTSSWLRRRWGLRTARPTRSMRCSSGCATDRWRAAASATSSRSGVSWR